MQTKARSFTELQAAYGDLLFDERKAAGIVPYNVGLLQHGKFMFALVGATSGHVASLYEKFSHTAHDVEPILSCGREAGRAA